MTASGVDSSTDRFSRIFDVLELLVGHPEGMTLTEIVKRLDLPTSSAHNLLRRMVLADVIGMTDDLRYSVGPRTVRLGIQVVDRLEVRAVARRVLLDLARETGEDVYLAIRLGNRVSYVDRVPGTQPVSVNIRLGQSLYLHATAVGKLFAAHLPQLRERLFAQPRPRLTPSTLTSVGELEAELGTIQATGIAFSREEAIPGITGLAVPVRDVGGAVAAAIHISAMSAQMAERHEKFLVKAARAAAAAIESELGVSAPASAAKA
jgi:IclR family transcriptional regulator, KDG regulon repressor